jgi:hypothetical protein
MIAFLPPYCLQKQRSSFHWIFVSLRLIAVVLFRPLLPKTFVFDGFIGGQR